MNRYKNDNIIKGGKVISSNQSIINIKKAIRDGKLATTIHILKEGERLDIIAGRFLGDARLWWVLAATSSIGWNLQVPPGTEILIPVSINSLRSLV